jgi:diguanylate cyclase (GGDEF)-like protein/PAS domain S-box-containing protein
VKILIVEDQDTMRRALRDFLELSLPAATVLEAADAASAFELCLAHRPALVLMDVSLPDGNGIELTGRIRSVLPDIAVIVVTQHAGPAYLERARAAGAGALVGKHALHRDLLPAIRSTVAQAEGPKPEQDRAPLAAESTGADRAAVAREAAARAGIEAALRTSERRLRAIVETEPECVKVVSRDGELLEMNPAGLAMLEAASLEEARRRPLLRYLAPEHRAAFRALHEHVMRGERGSLRFEVVGLKGTRRWLETHAAPLRDDAGNVYALLGVTRDISAQVWSERWSAAEHAILERIAKGEAASEVLDALCRAIEERIPGARCSILEVDEQGLHLRHLSAPSLPRRYVEAIDGAAIGEAAGSCGTAAHRREPVTVSDIRTDPLWREYRDVALRHGLRACWSTPILCERQEVLGTFAIYPAEAREPTEAERRLTERAAYLASIVMMRVRSDRALRESELRFRQLTENIREVFWLTDPAKKRMLYISPGYEQVWGRSCESLYRSPRDWVEAIHPEDRARVLEAAQTRQARGQYDEEYRIVRPDGSVRWIRDRAFPVAGDSGEVSRIAGVAEDITERKRAEESLRRNQERLGTLISSVDGIVWEADAQTLRFTFVSPRAERLLGYPLSRWTEESNFWRDHIHPDDRDQAVAYCLQCTRQSRDHEFEYRMLAADGRAVWLRDIVTVVSEGGRPTKLRGVMVDITERKQAEQRLRESEARFRRIAEQSPDAILMHQAGRIVFVNEAMVRLMRARAPERLIGKPATSVLHPEYTAIAEARIRRLYAGDALPPSEQRYVRLDGTTVDVEVAAAPFDLDGKPAALVTVRDITTRREQEKRIARLTRIYEVLSAINSAIVRVREREALLEEACRIATAHGGFTAAWIGSFNHATGNLIAVAHSGLPAEVVPNADESPLELIPQGPAQAALRTGTPAVSNDIASEPEFVESAVGPDTWNIRRAAIARGAQSVIVLPLFVEERTFGVLTLYASEREFFDEEELRLLTQLASDVSFALTFQAKEARVNYLAYHDVLTGLPNRTLLQDRLAQHLHAAQRDGTMTALILMDLERFRLLNETFGRQFADEVLKEVARRLHAAARAEDSLARVGGDRFALTLSRIADSAEVAHFLRNRLMPVLRDPVGPPGQALRVAARFAVAVFPPDGGTPDVLYSNAEAALKKAKESGERFLFYAPEMNAKVRKAFELENRLREALDEERFVLHYQPKIATGDRRITGFEALIRWNDPELGLVPPGEFVPLMEETGLILEAGRWALSQVARDCRTWGEQGVRPPRIAVNVSALELRQKDFLAVVTESAREIRAAGGALDLEITESVLMENVGGTAGMLLALREQGVTIAVDDFGTGYCSLAYIARLPIDALKIDRSFVDGMTSDADSLAIVTSVISLAHSLRLQVIAEGVETPQQAAMLEELGCDQMQGYLFSRPLSAEQVGAWLGQWPPGHEAATRRQK